MARQKAQVWDNLEGGELDPAVDERKRCKKIFLSAIGIRYRPAYAAGLSAASNKIGLTVNLN